MIIDFPGGSRVDAHVGQFSVATDQRPASSAPAPFLLFYHHWHMCVNLYSLLLPGLFSWDNKLEKPYECFY